VTTEDKADVVEIISRCGTNGTSLFDAGLIEHLMSPNQRVVHSGLLERVRDGISTFYDVEVLNRLFQL